MSGRRRRRARVRSTSSGSKPRLRVSTPAAGRGREAGFGVEWRPLPLPVALLVERRVDLDGGRGGTAVAAISGIDTLPIAAGFDLDGYAQAGGIARDRFTGFADAAVRVTRPAGDVGATQLQAGLGGWAAAQQGARRIDVGPSLVARLPVGERRLRIALDWRQRIAGNAEPGSGPALSVGADF